MTSSNNQNINPAADPGNCMAALISSMVFAQGSMQGQQIADTLLTQNLATLQANLNSYWNSPDVQFGPFFHITAGVLTFYADAIKALVAANASSSEITAAQTAYQQMSAAANASQGNADSMLTTSQAQSQQDSSNMQNLLTIVQSAMQLLGMLASLLSK